jgi:copper chaperone NosL
MLKYICIYLFAGFLLVSCNISPKEINYNGDQCDACKMMISDKRFGAELVTQKGKITKYDAIECLVEVVSKKGEQEYKHIMVTHFDNPSILQDAKTSIFLIEPTRPSPMGANLSAYDSRDKLADFEGSSALVLNWEELLLNHANR